MYVKLIAIVMLFYMKKAASIFVVDSVVLASGKYLMSTCYGRTKNLRICTHIFVPGLSLL